MKTTSDDSPSMEAVLGPCALSSIGTGGNAR